METQSRRRDGVRARMNKQKKWKQTLVCSGLAYVALQIDWLWRMLACTWHIIVILKLNTERAVEYRLPSSSSRQDIEKKEPTHNLICWMFIRRQTQHNMRAMAETKNVALLRHTNEQRVYFRVYMVITTFVPIGNRRSAIWNKECKERNECLSMWKSFLVLLSFRLYVFFFLSLARSLRSSVVWDYTQRNESTVCWNCCRHRVATKTHKIQVDA